MLVCNCCKDPYIIGGIMLPSWSGIEVPDETPLWDREGLPCIKGELLEKNGLKWDGKRGRWVMPNGKNFGIYSIIHGKDLLAQKDEVDKLIGDFNQLIQNYAGICSQLHITAKYFFRGHMKKAEKYAIEAQNYLEQIYLMFYHLYQKKEEGGIKKILSMIPYLITFTKRVKMLGCCRVEEL